MISEDQVWRACAKADPTAELKLSDDERAARCWHNWRGTTAQRLAMRARIVLTCADGLNNKKVARRLRTTAHTVGKWRARLVEARLDGLLDEPRPGAPRKIGPTTRWRQLL